ncbi:SDR family oxidoreductase [Streptomyces sp. BE147]|uniref:SDR family NAD(P)-dependent oxidoreductase n=1 Tax=Streptomyces sp. BE147 TaxID=3002524 RepID=UPI002E783320|nr:SDR family oxidoreductase [Streptomyces sp. BE147]MEE1737873.1 SDR family oxidoreductase [Streptomyces sp. BE147]
MSGRFAGRTVLITGSGHGIGAAMAADFVAEGAYVVINCFRDPEFAAATLSSLPGGSAEVIQADVRDQAWVRRMFATVAERHGSLDVLVNNAASGVFGQMSDLTARSWERAYETNFQGTLRCTEGAAELMSGGGGAIVNVSSLGVAVAVPQYAAVAASKAAVEALTRYHAVEYAPRGIRVNTASAGVIAGDNDSVNLPPEVIAAAEALTPLGRLGRASELSAVVRFLASPAASWITGQILHADGGMSVGYLAAAAKSASVQGP